jgi:hypothetical protein
MRRLLQENIVSTGSSGSRPGYNASPGGVLDPVPWDFCTPAPVASLAQDEVDRRAPCQIFYRILPNCTYMTQYIRS